MLRALRDRTRPRLRRASPGAESSGSSCNQPEVFDAAYYFARRLKVQYLIAIGISNISRLRNLGRTFQIVAVDSAQRLSEFRAAWDTDTPSDPPPLLGPLFEDGQAVTNDAEPLLIEHDLEAGLPRIPQAIASEAIALCSGVLERLKRPQALLCDLAGLARASPLVLISAMDQPRLNCDTSFDPLDARSTRISAADKFAQLLRSCGLETDLVGYTFAAGNDPQKGTQLAIAGAHGAPSIPPKLARVLAIMHVFNERDILIASVRHLLRQGIDVKVVDNWSSDGSYEEACRLATTEPRVTVERFPPGGPSLYFDLKEIMSNVERIAAQRTHDWVIHHDTDEFRAAPWPGMTLQQGISSVDALGYDAIDFTVVEFKPTQDGFAEGDDPERFFTHFDFGRFRGHFLQVKAWRSARSAELVDSAGHHATFPGQRIFPVKFLLKHYPVRSLVQAMEKLFKNRAPRIPPEERGKRFIQYDLRDGAKYLSKPEELRAYDPHTFASEYLLERTTGVGILRDSGYATGFAS